MLDELFKSSFLQVVKLEWQTFVFPHCCVLRKVQYALSPDHCYCRERPSGREGSNRGEETAGEEGKMMGQNTRKPGEMGVLLSPSSYCSCMTGQYIKRWAVGAKNTDFTLKASGPKRRWTSVLKNCLPWVRIQAYFILKGEGIKEYILH